MKKITVSILSVMLMLSMVFSSSVFAAEKEQSAWDSFVGLFAAKAPAAESEVGVEYRGHIQNVGNYPLDGTWVQGPAELGTEGKGLRLEGFWIKLNGEVPADTHIQYQVHVQNVGWMDPVQDGAFAGTEGKSLQIEAIKIKLVDDNGDLVKDYSVVYSGHVQNVGDVGPFTNGEKLGTEGSFLRLEAIEVEIVQNKADLTAYEEALAAVEESDYTPASWAAYQEVVEANVVTEDSLQSEVDAATAAIVEAQKDLVELGQVVGIVAINATTVEVTFADDVTEVDKSEFVIDGLAVTNAAIKQTNSKVVVLTTATQEGAKVYGLTYQGVDTGLTFTGISAVLPTAIKIADGTNFVTVGQEFTVKATVTTTDANKAGIPVTFNIKSTASPALNQNIVEERLTNADGVAEYTYTRYATETDTVSVYPTGAAATRDTRNISWSAQAILSVETSATNVIANDGNKTYTVTVRDQATGNVVNGRTVRVLFNENIGTINNTTASATDVTNGTRVQPFQRPTGNATALVLSTNSDGKATFSVTGKNTSATPIVFLDDQNVNAGVRLDAQDIQLWAPTVTFQGAQLENQITVTPDTDGTVAAATDRGRVYTVEVKKADGTAFAGGRVQIGFDQLIDNNIGTTTDAAFIWFDNDSTLRTTATTGVPANAGVTAANNAPWTRLTAATAPIPNRPNQMEIALNSAGKATFMIANFTQAQTATPIVWIDQDSTVTLQNNHTLEATEPNKLGGKTITEGQSVTSGNLAIDRATQASGQTATVTYEVRDQNGAAYLPAGDGNVRVTYSIANTGNNPLVVNRSAAADGTVAGTWSVNGAADTDIVAGANLVTINPGMTATVAVTLDRTTGPRTTLALTNAAGQDTTYSISAQGLTLTTNKSLAAAAVTGSFVNAVNIDTFAPGGTSVTGTIVSFSTADQDYFPVAQAAAQSGRVIMSVDGQPDTFVWFTYTQGLGSTVATPVDIGAGATRSFGDNLFVGTDSTFAANSPTTNATFESALSVGNKVRFTQAGAGAVTHRTQADRISLYNVNNTNDVTQINQTLPTPVVGAIGLATTTPYSAGAAAQPAVYLSNVIPATYGNTNITFTDELGATKTANIGGNSTPAQVATAVNAANVATTTVANVLANAAAAGGNVTVTIDGVATVVAIPAVGGGQTIASTITQINTAVGSPVAALVGSDLVITSPTAGTTSNVRIEAGAGLLLAGAVDQTDAAVQVVASSNAGNQLVLTSVTTGVAGQAGVTVSGNTTVFPVATASGAALTPVQAQVQTATVTTAFTAGQVITISDGVSTYTLTCIAGAPTTPASQFQASGNTTTDAARITASIAAAQGADVTVLARMIVNNPVANTLTFTQVTPGTGTVTIAVN